MTPNRWRPLAAADRTGDGCGEIGASASRQPILHAASVLGQARERVRPQARAGRLHMPQPADAKSRTLGRAEEGTLSRSHLVSAERVVLELSGRPPAPCAFRWDAR